MKNSDKAKAHSFQMFVMPIGDFLDDYFMARTGSARFKVCNKFDGNATLYDLLLSHASEKFKQDVKNDADRVGKSGELWYNIDEAKIIHGVQKSI
jgi:hypothetical protein